MRLMFVYYFYEYAGSARNIYYYSQAAGALGHEVVIHGPPNIHSSFRFSRDMESADAVVFLFEWTTDLRFGDHLDLARFLTEVPRERRIVIDCDGAYNDPLCVESDYNHRNADASRMWIEICDSLSDKICQPTLHPLRPNVRPFLFYAYNAIEEMPLDLWGKGYGMVYVGHSKFRWRAMQRVLRAVEPIRPKIGRIGLIGDGWDTLPPWAARMDMEDAYYTDHNYLRQLGIETSPPIPFEEVIPWMGKAIFNPVIHRPLFEHLRLVNPRMFETFAASTIPVFGPGSEHVEEIYGQRARELMLGHEGPDKILDILARPERYIDIVKEIRCHLAEKHSHTARLKELIKIVDA